MQKNLHTAVIALGSNLGASETTVRQAAERLARHPEMLSLTLSPLYRTAPVGYTRQPDFINAVAIVETRLDAAGLLGLLQDTEALFGRRRSFPNAPRTLDLDIIDYDGIHSGDPKLTLPHPRARLRAFVMRPLADIAPGFLLGKEMPSAQENALMLGTEGMSLIGPAV
ncbi:MAG: 2-amino-4-hydroxy-6-hydroxymethyldihydropteridine diphosphokinase [Neisseria sp.]|nr:2-amino-4-hydroxy-6-hydroxymethyldihydropteridine diphosphokinase [Neisseria sp.]